MTFYAGDPVLARWTDNQYYSGRVAEHESGGKIVINFFDGGEITHSRDDQTAVIHDAVGSIFYGSHVVAPVPKGGTQYSIGYVIQKSGTTCKVLFDDNSEDNYYCTQLRSFPDESSYFFYTYDVQSGKYGEYVFMLMNGKIYPQKQSVKKGRSCAIPYSKQLSICIIITVEPQYLEPG